MPIFSPPWGCRCAHCTPWLRLCWSAWFYDHRKWPTGHWAWIYVVNISTTKIDSTMVTTQHEQKAIVSIFCRNHRYLLITDKDGTRFFTFSALNLSTVNCYQWGIFLLFTSLTFTWLLFYLLLVGTYIALLLRMVNSYFLFSFLSSSYNPILFSHQNCTRFTSIETTAIDS